MNTTHTEMATWAEVKNVLKSRVLFVKAYADLLAEENNQPKSAVRMALGKYVINNNLNARDLHNVKIDNLDVEAEIIGNKTDAELRFEALAQWSSENVDYVYRDSEGEVHSLGSMLEDLACRGRVPTFVTAGYPDYEKKIRTKAYRLLQREKFANRISEIRAANDVQEVLDDTEDPFYNLAPIHGCAP